MKKQKSSRINESKWIYFVFNWGSPIGVFTNVTLAAALFKCYHDKWGNPLPEGALLVKRYRPSSGSFFFTEEDITGSIQKIVCND